MMTICVVPKDEIISKRKRSGYWDLNRAAPFREMIW